MKEIQEWLKGKKTYAFALGIAIVTFLYQVGWIDQHTYDFLIGMFGAGGLASLRAGINKKGGE